MHHDSWRAFVEHYLLAKAKSMALAYCKKVVWAYCEKRISQFYDQLFYAMFVNPCVELLAKLALPAVLIVSLCPVAAVCIVKASRR